MEKTIERSGIKITLDLNADESVNIKKMMIVEYDGKSEKMYPDVAEGKKFGTIAAQFGLASANKKLDEAIAQRSK